MRIDVKKFLFVGTSDVRNLFFEEAQKEGIIDFIDAKASKGRELPLEIEKIIAAIKVLRGLPTAEQEELKDFTLADEIVNQVLELHDAIERLEEERRVTKLEIARVEIFGDFSLEDIEYIEREGKRKIQYYCAKKGFAEENELADPIIQIGSDHGLDYFVAVNDAPTQYEGMIEMKIDHPVGKLERRLADIEVEIKGVEAKIKEFIKYNAFLHGALIDKMNSYNLVTAEEGVSEEMEGSLFVVQGWVPVSKISLLQKLVTKKSVHYEEIGVEEGEVAPTCLENERLNRIGEDLVHIYDTPSNTDKDPSLWVLGFFALFFAFIVGDGGYGFIFFAIALYLHFKFKGVKRLAKRMLSLFMILSVSCIAWGFLTNSFFGLNFGPNSPLQKVSFVSWMVEKKVAYHQNLADETYDKWVSLYPQIDVGHHPRTILSLMTKERGGKKIYELFDDYSDSVMLELALFVGILHISLSFLRYLGRNWAGIGWVAFIVGGYFYFPVYLNTETMMNYVFGFDRALLGLEGIYLMWGGFALALVLSLVQNKLMGILEVMTVVQVFGDILSYLRLYALGLAGGIVSATVNELSASLFFAGGIIVLIIGHLINIALSVMGGVIHGLRLNFLEWYHYSFEGGGKLFSPLRKVETD